MANTYEAEGTVEFRFDCSHSLVRDTQTITYPITEAKKKTYTAGAGEDQIRETAVHDETDLASAGTLVLDFYNNIFYNMTGEIPLLLREVKEILVVAEADNDGAIRVSPYATNGFDGWIGGTSPYLDCEPGGFLALSRPKTGWTVLNNSKDRLSFVNQGAQPASFQVFICGTR